MNSRIDHKHKHSGDKGYSNIINGHTLRKDDPACDIFSSVEWLNNKVSLLISEFDIKNDKLDYILRWLKNYSFNISAFVFMKGDSLKYKIDESFLNDFYHVVESLEENKEIATVPDFISYGEGKYLKLDEIRIIVRDLERAYTSWRYHELILRYIAYELDSASVQTVRDNINSYGCFLNRLSTFFWLASRQESFLEENNQEIYWNN